jgi:putative FmdB family regulatory protein
LPSSLKSGEPGPQIVEQIDGGEAHTLESKQNRYATLIQESMPLYEYECKKCHHRFEKIQKFSDPHVKKCPKCGGPIEQVISAPAVQFKGSGWYVTDYPKKSSAGSSPASSDGDGTSKGDSGSPSDSGSKTGSDSKKESKPKSESKAETKKTEKK